ncbi:TetR/AcrR family transcriptional regulator [Clostridium intestinale]|uniref:TetR family transcriptional regulator n=2 Tax=Clostridium intestinale TaxID=36845 RepID=U2NLW4_9CLOT|nr:TetR/AcrR family transcriptional regulator [Clostridium intestinale]ERK30128.1 TetR family transcriptional regulator [Clostridium intestinale URNW]QLY82188.1 TetR/AcrR family transcriptional regulator [Clostridium intestinale]
MRITKEHDERRNEILDVTEKLFHIKGYDKCTISDILKEVGIAKGTFYHYFKSKEEVLDAIVSRYKDVVITRVNEVANNNFITLEEKLLGAFMSMRIIDQLDSEVINEMHKTENALLHQKILNQIVIDVAPILVKIIKEGVEKKVWRCKFPLEYMQIFLTSSITLTDEGIFEFDGEYKSKIMEALISVLEKMLEVSENSFIKLFKERGF